MRNLYLSKCIILLLNISFSGIFAQGINHNAGVTATHSVTTTCNCWIQRDATWQVAQFTNGIAPDYRNDDGYTDTITLPFNFCFYGQTQNKVFINNNGNVSFGSPYSTYTADSFPNPNFKMIAPFWSDVDTRDPASGIVWYKIDPKYMIVQWDAVGYYNSHSDLLNSFQLIITDGTDPIINIGQNVNFCYKDMQWTTGDASNGHNGIGGHDSCATVGVNEGNGINYIQFGRFDTLGNRYDGPFGGFDGIDWLDNRTFTMNVCVADTNIPPVLNSLNVCDTIRLCENSTMTLTADYLSPEQSQITNITLHTFGTQGVTIVSNTPGNTASMVWQINGGIAGVGFHTIAITAQDNGTPVAATNNNFVFEVLPAPQAAYTYTPSQFISTSTSVSFTNTSTPVAGVIYTWDFGDNSPQVNTVDATHTFTTAGVYNVILRDSFPNGCVTIDTQQVTVCGPVTFSTTNVCQGSPSSISMTSFYPPNSNFTWDFAGGTVVSGSGAGPYQVSWSTAGTFDVTVIVADSSCTVSDTETVVISPGPLASITNVSALCAGGIANVNFNGNTGPNTIYSWNFGNATVLSGSGSGPYQVQYNNAGPDQISLMIDDGGCTDSTGMVVNVNAIPTSLFTVSNDTCAGQPISITYTGSASAGAIYNWTFGTANVLSGSGAGPYTLSWNSPNTYQISLVVTDSGCVSAQTDMNAIVNPVPVALAGIDQSSCSGVAVPLGDVPVAGTVYSWSPATDLSDPTISNPTATVQNNGAADIQRNYIITVTDPGGCSNTDTVMVTTHPVPVIAFPALPGQCIDNNLFNFMATSNISGTMNYNWLFGGPSSIPSSTQQTVNVSYSSVGVFPVLLTGDVSGCPAQPYADSVAVYPMPVPNFTELNIQGCRPLTVSFTNLTQGALTYNWNFGDGGLSTTANPVYTFNTPGKFSVTLSAKNSNGCSTDTVYPNLIQVFADAVANFQPSPSVANILAPTVTFQNYSTNASSYLWDFGDSTALSTDAGPSHTYNAIGTYNVTLFISSPNGCVDTVQGVVVVEDVFSFYIPSAFTPNGDGVNDMFGGYGVAVNSYSMNIYNRWGELIYNTNNIEQGWDGKMKSGPILNDTYVYRIDLTDLHGEKHTYVGDVTVVY